VIDITYVEVGLGNSPRRHGCPIRRGGHGYQADTAVESNGDRKVRGAVVAQPEEFQRRKVSSADGEQLPLPQVQE
jgi:hypothetical protein